MKYFVKTLFARRLGIVTVLRDSRARTFEVYLWRATGGCDLVGLFPYQSSDVESVQAVALGEARRQRRILLGTPVVVCAWCEPPDRLAEASRAATASGAIVAQTICPTCLARMESEINGGGEG